MAKNAMISAPQPEAAEAGADVIRAGGNAIDAAIACAFVQGVVDPLMTGIAGFGSVGVYDPTSKYHGYLDFHAPAPAATRPDMWSNLIESETRDGWGFILKGYVNELGRQAIAVPGSLKAYSEVHRRFGKLPWAELLQPAIEWAEKGWVVRPHVHWFWTSDTGFGRLPIQHKLSHTASGRELYCRPDGTPKVVGDLVVNRDYASTLRIIARDGADAFYKGEIADRIDVDMRENGGILRRADLEQYEPVWTKPLWGDYRHYKVSTNQPPGGGIMLLQMMNILENFDLRGMGHNSAEYIRTVSEAMKRATIDKDLKVGDPNFVKVPVDELTSKDYALLQANLIKEGQVARVTRLNSGMPSKDTTHVSVVDRDGICVTMTHSLGLPSGVITKGLGFMYNGCMAVFDPRPGRAGSLAPGKGRFSSLCPSIIFRDGRPHVVIGAPGATQIAMGVLQAILNVLDFDMTMTEAVSAARFSATSDMIDVSNRISYGTCRKLEERGYEVVRSPYGFGFAAVHSIKIDGDKLDGGADPGHDGVAWKI